MSTASTFAAAGRAANNLVSTVSGHRVWSDHSCSATRPSRVSQASARTGPGDADRNGGAVPLDLLGCGRRR